MLTFLDIITGFIAPHKCLGCSAEGSLLCVACMALLPPPVPRCYRCHRTDSGWDTCKACRRQSPLQKVITSTTYEGIGEVLVRKLKFERAYEANDAMASVMSGLVSLDSVLVPIPTATSRVRQRGYDQSVLLARRLARYANTECVELLERLGQQRQTGSTRLDRLKQLDGAFEVKARKLSQVNVVTLVDDVMTTGATLEAAARILRASGVKHIDAVTFARAE